MIRWPWKREEYGKMNVEGNGDAAKSARRVAEENLQTQLNKQPKIDEAVRVSRQLGAQNSFGERIERAFRRRRAI